MLHFTEEQELLRDTIRDFVRREVDWERDRQADAQEIFPEHYTRRLAEMGMAALPIAEDYGGAGGSIVDVTIVVEELAKGSRQACGVYAHDAIFAGLQFSTNGSEQQKREILPLVAKGAIRFAIAMTEPDAGSDVASLKTQARREGDNFIINGSKIYITLADVSDYVLALVRTDPNVAKHRGLTIFIVPREAPGLRVRRLDKLGQRSISTCEVYFDDVQAPLANVVGGPEMLNRAWQQILSTLDDERIVISALCIGQSQKALDLAVDYARQRVQFDRPIGSFQAIQHMLADMATSILASRLMTYHVARLKERQQPCSQEAAMAKLFTSETCKKVALDGLQIMGGSGYMMENPMQQCVRDSLIDTIYGGTSQIQRTIIARGLGLPRDS